jgi:hypothetical protein
VDLQITPEPTEEERAAIAKALELAAEEATASAWPRRILPSRDADEA